MMADFSVSDDPLGAVSGGSSAITFLVLPEVFAQAPGGPVVQLLMVTMFGRKLLVTGLVRNRSIPEQYLLLNLVHHG